jgi:two-component system, OmpR family, sensor histidine kinase KdpD
MVTSDSNASSKPFPDVPWSDVTRFVRQLSHDLRNHLNAAELQSAFLGEIATDPELKEEIKRLRTMLTTLGGALQKLSTDMGHARASLMEYKASDFLEDLRAKIESKKAKEAPKILWDVQVDDAILKIDPQLLPQAIEELVENAARHAPSGAPIQISAAIDARDGLVLTLIEPKEGFELSTENWGREPMRNITQGHYSLGLNRARIIMEAHGGRLVAHYDDGSKHLMTKITLPVAEESK